LGAIVIKAMAYEPENRYQRVEELQAEVLAWQGGFAPKAERASLGKQIWLWVIRHKTEVTLVSTFVVLAFAAIIWALLHLQKERDLAVKAEKDARRAREEAVDALSRAERSETKAAQALGELRETAYIFASEADSLIEDGNFKEALRVIDDAIEIEINEADLRIDTFRSSGAGGQHVNTTDSAVRITHIPTGIVVACQGERSQHKNRATAWNMLRARLYEREIERREAEANAQAASKTEIGWGHQIRSYVLQPYQMVKDLRTGVVSGTPDDVLDGDIDEFMEAALAQRVEGGGPVHVEDVD
jgi:tetratricopeptide (TPR) repeat protein